MEAEIVRTDGRTVRRFSKFLLHYVMITMKNTFSLNRRAVNRQREKKNNRRLPFVNHSQFVCNEVIALWFLLAFQIWLDFFLFRLVEKVDQPTNLANPLQAARRLN